MKAGDTYYLELFHGATIAFKDMALSILPHLVTTSAKKNHVDKGNRHFDSHLRRYRKGCNGRICRCGRNENYCILSERTVSAEVQKLQMVTQKGK